MSIGIPLYNAERYLPDSLDSLIAQDREDLEFIVSDNASTDLTWEICQDYARRDSRFRLYRNTENVGAAANFNLTVGLAEADLFKWAAYDDICAPGLVSACADALEQTGPAAILAYAQTTLIDDDGHEVGHYRDGLSLRASSPYQRIARLALNLSQCNPQYGVIRLDALRRTGRIRPDVGSDYALLAELAMIGEFVEVRRRLFFRRIHAGSSRQGATDARTAAQLLDPRGHDTARRAKPRVGPYVARLLLQADHGLGSRLAGATVFFTAWGARKAHIKGSHLKHRFLGGAPTAPRVTPVR